MEKIRILYAEDYDLILFAAKHLLEAEGWEVEVCRDGADTLKKLEGDARFDLLILDDRIGGVSGSELVERARGDSRLRATPIILFTTQQAANDGPAACAADACLSKPGGLKDLVETCRRLLQRAAPPEGVDLRTAESNDGSG